MAASLLRMGRLSRVKAAGWISLRAAPTARSFGTKSGGSKKSTKNLTDKNHAKTYFDIEKLVQHKPFEKEASPAATAAEEAAAIATAAPAPEPTPSAAEPTPSAAEPTPSAAEPTPSAAEPTPSAAEPTPSAAAATPVMESTIPVVTATPTSEAIPEPAPAAEATPVIEALAASVAVSESAPAGAPVAEVVLKAEPVVKVEAVVEATTSIAEDASTVDTFDEAAGHVAEAVPVVEAAPATPLVVGETTPDVFPAESLVEAVPIEATLGPVAEAVPVVEAAPATPPVEATPTEALNESAHAETTAVGETAPEVFPAESLEEAVPIEATLGPVAEAAFGETAPELVADAAPGEVSVPPESTEELVDPAPVVAEGEEHKAEAEPADPPEAQLDPIQKLFLDSIRQYSTKSQATQGLVDAGLEYEKALAEEIAKLQRLYGGGDLTSFPTFKFTEPTLDEVSQK